LRAFTEGLIEGHIATDIIITISIWAGPIALTTVIDQNQSSSGLVGALIS
jgi:hypothetical protein